MVILAPSRILTAAAAYPACPQVWDTITMDAIKYRKVKIAAITKCWKSNTLEVLQVVSLAHTQG